MEQVKPLFSLGDVVATRTVADLVPQAHLIHCLGRHVRGDWGSVCEEDAATNHEAVQNGDRLLSAYPLDEAKPCEGFGDNTLWIITESDRSATTFLFPNEY
jgi:hypothetical protein